jgi:hypothetical protein
VVAGAAFALVTVLAWFAVNAHHPAVAAGIALQTLAGLLAAVQLWANNASDAMVGWAARQIAHNRWRLAGLFDGRLRSLALAAAWLLTAVAADVLFLAWSPGEIVGWPIAILLAANFIVATPIFLLVLFVWGGAQIVDGEALADGEALTSLQARLDANWVWPIVALAFLVGGLLQLAAA